MPSPVLGLSAGLSLSRVAPMGGERWSPAGNGGLRRGQGGRRARGSKSVAGGNLMDPALAAVGVVSIRGDGGRRVAGVRRTRTRPHRVAWFSTEAHQSRWRMMSSGLNLPSSTESPHILQQE
uniref:Uncharacterized protein n=1 Tax=Oryza barthii TaxID=65489 RepID=A0A0D3EX50_9ORYZ